MYTQEIYSNSQEMGYQLSLLKTQHYTFPGYDAVYRLPLYMCIGDICIQAQRTRVRSRSLAHFVVHTHGAHALTAHTRALFAR